MISKHDILKFVRHVHRRGRGVPDRRLMHPRREWLLGLGVFLVITGVGAVGSMITFDRYQKIDKQTYVVEVTVPSYHEARTDTVLNTFAERQARYESLISGIEFVVPDLPDLSVGSTSSSTVSDSLNDLTASSAPLVIE